MNKKLFKKSFAGFMVLTIFLWPLAPISASPAINKIAADDDVLLRKLQVEQLEKTGQLKGFDSKKETKTFSADEGLKKMADVKQPQKQNYVEGEVLVKFKEQKINLEQYSGRLKAKQFAVNKNLDKKEDIRKSNISVLKTKGDESVEGMVERLKNDEMVEYVEPNYMRQWTSTIPNDSDFSSLWGLHNTTVDADIDAPEAWDIFTGSDSIVVAVLDSGIAYNHPDLINNMWNGNANHGWDFFNNDNNPIDDNGHGTHVAGTIGAEGNNNLGVAGVNWDVKLMALKVGDYAGNVGDIADAIDFAISNNVKIINASFSGPEDSQAEFDAIDRFRQAGGIFVAAAGNGGADGVGDNNDLNSQYPADYALDNIISVAATDQNDNLASFSNFGNTSVDVGAPGVNIYSTVAGATVDGSVIFSENFNGVVPHSIGDKFTQDIDSTWGTISGGDDNIFIASDYANWGSYQNDIYSRLYSPIINLNGKANSYLKFIVGCNTEPVYDSLGLWLYNGQEWDLVDVYSGEMV
ncbi:S8 family serine peptidase, partial [Patescibacteria group bacterium]|nr:S8 family serine peptidase [Patescibacteria group bacterium]